MTDIMLFLKIQSMNNNNY